MEARLSERGYISIDRGIFDHPFFAREKFTELQAWMWMLHAAVWKATRVRVGRKLIALERGQLCFSERFLAEKFMWSKSRVRRFLDRLQTEAMADHQADHDATHITICNYNKYQLGRTVGETTNETETGPLADHSRTKEEELKQERNKKEESIGAVAPPPNAGKVFDEQFWCSYPRRDGANPKAPARQAFLIAVKNGGDPAAIIAGAQRYAADLAKSNKVGTPYVAQAKTWLHQKRWEDYPDEIAHAHGPPQPPRPGMEKDEVLRKRYEAIRAIAQRNQGQGGGLRPEGAGVRRENGAQEPPEPTDDKAGDGGMGCVGALFRQLPGLPTMDDGPRRMAPPGGSDGQSDDGSDAMAGMVRH